MNAQSHAVEVGPARDARDGARRLFDPARDL
jgi:hypothetical protein